ncbi:MAG: 6-carboxytetrahydropterin synthase [Gemmatimonadaceae bacterium]|nr:6-carboxytetrahydropterin synthase [Gemmatimonadaceae bacterium]
MPIVTVTRLVRFNAAHRVYNPSWSDERNQATFGKCNNPNWHGHNYTLEITVEGRVDPETGYVLDLGEVKRIAQDELVRHVDHKNLNLDVPFMQGTIPTTENLVLACWRVLAPKLAPARLVRLKLWETENHYVEYDGR